MFISVIRIVKPFVTVLVIGGLDSFPGKLNNRQRVARPRHHVSSCPVDPGRDRRRGGGPRRGRRSVLRREPLGRGWGSGGRSHLLSVPVPRRSGGRRSALRPGPRPSPRGAALGGTHAPRIFDPR